MHFIVFTGRQLFTSHNPVKISPGHSDRPVLRLLLSCAAVSRPTRLYFTLFVYLLKNKMMRAGPLPEAGATVVPLVPLRGN